MSFSYMANIDRCSRPCLLLTQHGKSNEWQGLSIATDKLAAKSQIETLSPDCVVPVVPMKDIVCQVSPSLLYPHTGFRV